MPTPILSLKHVTKKIGSRKIIDDISFDVPRGEVFGFLGPNGAGKTTTIRMIVGLMAISEGEILINGESIQSDFESAIGYVGGIVENPEMYKYLSGYKNLVHYARMHKGITKQRIMEMVNLVGLNSRIHDKVKSYSLGMRQRLGVAQALLHKPQLLILDEPTNGLDPAGIRELRDYLRVLTRELGITVFVSSHLLAEMELMCDRIAIIQDGKLVTVRRLADFTSLRTNEVVFEVDDTNLAVSVLKQWNPDVEVNVQPGKLTFELDKDEIADVNATFVQANIRVSGIQLHNVTLEDQFLEMTKSGGERHV
jgi:ABC-2 type transport system ATP-binding protein